ncbi:MFS general substrate transporter [Neurospora tetrasperma FGSC 2509]|nr:MFS general substrate transporter [Neurospora tetrasperma FGSC 2509]
MADPTPGHTAPDTAPPSWRSEDNRSPVLAPHPATVPASGTLPSNTQLLDANTEITHLYLTFAILPPSANTTHQSSGSTTPQNDVPPPPNLKPFTNPILCSTAILGGISTFCLGFALAPMFLAPFSEMNGRQPVFVAAGIMFVIFQVVCGVVETLEGMLIARFFLGVGASVFSTMVGGVIADIWPTAERNTPMALFSGAVLCGTGLGPLVSAYMTERWGTDADGNIEEGNGAKWKWIFWHQVILGGALMVALMVFFKESRGSVLLSRKAKALNRWYEQLEEKGFYGVWVDEEEEEGDNGNADADDEEKGPSSPGTKTLQRIRWKVKEDEERGSLTTMIGTSVYRPFHLLFTEPVVFFFSLWAAFAWGVLYLTFGSIPLVFRRQYGWNIEQGGRIFVAMIVGAILATAMGIWQEKMLHHPKWRAAAPVTSSSTEETSASDTEGPNALPYSSDEPKTPSDSTTTTKENPIWPFLRTHFPTNSPEARLYFTCLTATFLPVGLFIFGFTARPYYHWIAPTIGIGIATMGILSVYLAVFNYLADTYHRYASSALAAQSFCRNILGGVFPLVTAPLFTNLGEGRAGAILGGVAVGLTAVPWVLVWCGSWVRGRSRFALQLEKS